MYLAITKNPERGRFTLRRGHRLAPGSAGGGTRTRPPVAAAKNLFDRINRRTPPSTGTTCSAGNKVFADDFTYHPLGGCVLGDGHRRLRAGEGVSRGCT